MLPRFYTLGFWPDRSPKKMAQLHVYFLFFYKKNFLFSYRTAFFNFPAT